MCFTSHLMSIHIAVASPLLVQFDCLSFMLVRRSSFSIVWRLAVVQAILTMQHALHINGATQQRKRLIGGLWFSSHANN